MGKRISETTPVFFSVAEGVGNYWISLDIGGDELPPELDDALISIRPRPGVSFEKVQEIAKLLNEHFGDFHYQHPIKQ